MRVAESPRENAYWNVSPRGKPSRSAERAGPGGEVLERSQKELELGAISPLDIYNPERTRPPPKSTVSQAKFALAQADDAVRKQIGVDLDPEARKLPIVLTETQAEVMPGATLRLDPEAEVEKALTARPELKSTLQSLDVDELSIKKLAEPSCPESRPHRRLHGTGPRRHVLPALQRVQLLGHQPDPESAAGRLGDALDQMFDWATRSGRSG